MRLLIPVPEKPTTGISPAPRVAGLRGRTVGLIDNGWWCLDVLYGVFQTQLAEEYGVSRTVRAKKYPTAATPAADLERLATECGAVITGLGN